MIKCPATDQEWEDYYTLRYDILRKPLGKEPGSERNEGDDSGIHIAFYFMDELAAIARLDQASENIGQVRFVASAEKFRGKGFGKAVMIEAERLSKERGDTHMILHARDYAVDFYLSLDYHIVEKSYKLFDVLQHYLMEKKY